MASAMNAVVTGTSRGIGLELTKQLLEAGHKVSALARNPDKSPGLAELRKKFPDRLKLFAVDVNSDAQVDAFVREAGSDPVDLLINNAGVYGEGEGFEKLSLETTAQTILTNAIAPMRVTRAILPRLRKSKEPKVVQITSLMGSIGDNGGGGYYGYRMSKAALNMFHKSFSIDYPEIISLTMHPGWVKTDMGGEQAPTLPKESAKGILAVVEHAKKKDSGKFYDFEGDELPW